MRHKRKRINWFRILLLLLLIAIGVYVNKVVIPAVPPPFIPSPTATRNPESYITEAEGLFAQGKLLQAIAVYEAAIRIKPKDSTIYVALARVQVFAGRYEDALTNAKDALLCNRNNSMAYAVRGWALVFMEDFLASEAALKRALELDPNNGLAHAYYAELLADMYINNIGPFDAITLAAEESKVALSLAPNTLEAHRARGYILEVTGNWEEAAREYQAAIAINGNIPFLHLELGRTYRALGVFDKAVEEFTIANTLNPTDPLPDLYISRTYAYLGQYAKAVQFAEEAVQDEPTNPDLRGNLGVRYYHNFQWPQAAEQLTFVVHGGTTEDGLTIPPLPLSNETRVVEYYFTYGLVLARLDRCTEALPIFQFILAAVPSDEIAIYNAKEGNRICEQSLKTPSPTPLVSPTPPKSTPTP